MTTPPAPPGRQRRPQERGHLAGLPGGWQRDFRLSGFTVVMLGVIVLAVLVLAPSVRTVAEQQQQIAALEAERDRQEQAVVDLQQERERWEDPNYVMAQARERLYYVMPGETSYLVIDDEVVPEETDPGVTSAELQRTDADWLTALAESTVLAGLGTGSQTATGDGTVPVPGGSGEDDEDDYIDDGGAGQPTEGEQPAESEQPDPSASAPTETGEPAASEEPAQPGDLLPVPGTGGAR